MHFRRFGRVILATVLVLSSIGVVTRPTVSRAQESEQPEITQQETALALFNALAEPHDPAAVADWLKEALRISRRRCSKITDYQLFDVRPNRVVLKAKCPGRPLYGLTVANNGYLAVYGGDGILAPLSLGDGEIISLSDRDRDVRRALASGRDEDGLSGWNLDAAQTLQTALYISLMIGAALLLVGYWTLIRASARSPHAKALAKQLAGHSKDALIAESEEILPNIFAHPSGLFIARGRHGKRRCFTLLLGAVLYRRFGVKLREIDIEPPARRHLS